MKPDKEGEPSISAVKRWSENPSGIRGAPVVRGPSKPAPDTSYFIMPASAATKVLGRKWKPE